ncbi:hypothetical protein S83_032031, partial [Arachis hypogaea]
ENSSTLCNKGGDGFQVEKRKVKTKLTASVKFLAALNNFFWTGKRQRELTSCCDTVYNNFIWHLKMKELS